MPPSCPAHATKHVPLLAFSTPNATFHLAQLQDGVANGTALWLGAQCLAAYLAESHLRYRSTPPTPAAIELGSGVGLTALSLTSLGWNVLATDISLVITSVLNSNVRNNYHVLPPGSGHIQLAELDWLVPPHHWRWDHPDIIASTAVSPLPSLREPLLPPPYDLICTADTIYDSALLTPLLRSLHTLSSLSAAVSPTRRPPPVLLCLERRDPALVDRFIHEAATTWHFLTERIPHRKLAKAIKKHYPHWSKHDWEGVELWKLILITNPRSVDACAE
ncbi:hypothetical protein Agabi119p4_3138 [Agaricus bisporus var. burnettii]|uniref:Methyltransferase-domain-containing protein n=1 Tax=Agaricus bisporus var. burnettii TaxID=192524 RepID=A0A8H7KIV8_AGABI|nr:hypothetical protein Agabi119p4_3138 [Agaricus bisporus var. burnettii]